VITNAAATLAIMGAILTKTLAAFACLRLVRQPEAGQRHASDADAEFLESLSSCDRLGHLFR